MFCFCLPGRQFSDTTLKFLRKSLRKEYQLSVLIAMCQWVMITIICNSILITQIVASEDWMRCR